MELRGSLVRDVARSPIGRVEDVLLDPGTLDPRWLQIALDRDRSTVLVPAASASEFAPGELLVPYPADLVTAAVHPGGTPLAAEDAEQLRRHYGFPN